MCKSLFMFCCVGALLGGAWVGLAADSAATAGSKDIPLTVDLLKEIQNNQYIDKSVQTTNGNVVGIYADVINDQSGQPAFLMMQVYENVSLGDDFVAVPWNIMRFDQQHRRIEIAAAADYLRQAPKFDRARLEAIKSNPEELAKLQHAMGAAMGGGAVSGTMGTQSGQGASSFNPPRTNDAQPQRGSVTMMYILGLLAAGIVAIALFARRRA